MKRLFIFIACLAMLICFTGCGSQRKEDEKFTIVVTSFPHYDFARQLTKNIDNIEIKMLISPGSELHTYEPTPGDILSITECDMFIYTGGEGDVWIKDILDTIDKSEMQVISFMEICDEKGTSHEGHHHSHDEHVWTSPKNAKLICQNICLSLCKKDAENTAAYTKNLDEYIRELDLLDNEFKDIAKNKKRSEIIVGDRFPFLHLAEEYGFHYSAAFNGCSESTEPTAKTIASLYKKVHEDNIPYVFTIEFSNGKIADSIIDKSSAKKLALHSCHNVSLDDFKNGVTYIELMWQNANNLRKALCE